MSKHPTILNTIIGTEAGDSIRGTSGDDSILGLGGNDNLYGELGNDIIDGGDGNDFIMPTASGATGHYGMDIVSAGAGNDLVNYNFSSDAVFIDGGADDDSIFGGSAADHILGGAGNDRMAGNAGGDILTGGAGQDSFLYYNIGESGLDISTADRITDFNAVDDSLDMLEAGKQPGYPQWHLLGNYTETSIAYGAGFEAAEAAAAEMIWPAFHYYPDHIYAFVTDGVNGFLFADLDHSGTADTAVILEGLTSVNQFAAADIV